MDGLENKVALVTGGGSGIGREICVRLAKEGAKVAINDIDGEAAQGTLDLIEENGGEGTTAIADVTDIEAVRAAVSDVIDKWGRIDILVNNAGWDRPLDWFVNDDPEIWDDIIDLNFKGQLNCSRVVAEKFMDQGEGGKIINIASDTGRVGGTGEVVYSGTKGAVIAYTKTLARELAHYKVNCNAVSPGLVKTPLTQGQEEETELSKKVFKAIEKQTPFKRLGKPEEIAAAVAFLASEDADFITGQVLSVSGGMTMVD